MLDYFTVVDEFISYFVTDIFEDQFTYSSYFIFRLINESCGCIIFKFQFVVF